MAEYNTYSIRILLEADGDLERRIAKSAENRGISFQVALEETVEIGLWKHMERNMHLVESVYPCAENMDL